MIPRHMPGIKTTPVVANAEHHAAISTLQFDAHLRRSSMLGNIIECLLRNAIQHDLYVGGDLAGSPTVQGNGDAQPTAHRVDQLREQFR